ncbi:helix-turn-helix domain-containing protein [Bacteroides fluxus]|uniref:helix-turn-helix domain-containing protein n=1 Tax=Bacteroides fluxus TaxID=626930 RepID=UPI002A7EC7CA|nr:helix-turn-helix domain-containing protein [Bacteroides fluxus]MDY3788331.1 helix-turn-helix domain-containing protein [Bacteroides fluxus]
MGLNLTLRQEETPGFMEEEKEKQLLLQTLEQAENNRARTAMMLDISRTTLYENLRKYGIV